MLCRPAGSSARARPAGHLTHSHLTRQVLPLVLLYELAQVGDALDLRREGGGPLSSTAHAFTINRHARIHRHTIAKALHKDNPAAQRRSVQRAWARMVRVVRTHQRAAGLDEGGWLPARRRAEAPDPLEVGGREAGPTALPVCVPMRERACKHALRCCSRPTQALCSRQRGCAHITCSTPPALHAPRKPTCASPWLRHACTHSAPLSDMPGCWRAGRSPTSLLLLLHGRF